MNPVFHRHGHHCTANAGTSITGYIQSLNELSWPKLDLDVHCKLSKSNIFHYHQFQVMEPENYEALALESFVGRPGAVHRLRGLAQIVDCLAQLWGPQSVQPSRFPGSWWRRKKITESTVWNENLTELNVVRKAAIAVICCDRDHYHAVQFLQFMQFTQSKRQSYPNSVLIPGRQVGAVADGKGISFPCSPMSVPRGERLSLFLLDLTCIYIYICGNAKLCIWIFFASYSSDSVSGFNLQAFFLLSCCGNIFLAMMV